MAALTSQKTRRTARASLITVWLATAIASLPGWHGQGLALLHRTALPQAWHLPLIYAGAALDAALGLALWRWDSRTLYRAAGVAMAGLTLIASCLLPSLWLDPLGCLTKNLPIAALLLMLSEDTPS